VLRAAPPCHMSARADSAAGTDPDSTTEHIKTAIDEDKLCFLLFAISVVGSVSCWSGVLVMPDWIYWGDKMHGLSFEITGPLFSLVTGYSYIKATGSRSRLHLLGAERLAGIALALSLACLYLINLRTLGVRNDTEHKDNAYTEEAYNYYLIGSVINIGAMLVTLNQVFKRRCHLKSFVDDQYDLERKWRSMQGDKVSSDPSAAETGRKESYAERTKRKEMEAQKNRPKNLVAAAEEHEFDDPEKFDEEDEMLEHEVKL